MAYKPATALQMLSAGGKTPAVATPVKKDAVVTSRSLLSKTTTKAENKPTVTGKGEKKASKKEGKVTARDIIKKQSKKDHAAAEKIKGEKPAGEDKLKTNITKAAKESVKLRKNIVDIVNKLKVYEGIINDVKNTIAKGGEPVVVLHRVQSIISAGGNAYQLAESQMEEKATLGGAVSDVAKSVQKAVPGVAAFALALPLLMSPQVREMIMSFFTGFLEGLGMDVESIQRWIPIIKIALGALAAVFTISALQPVVTLWGHMQKLMSFIGVAAELVVAKSEASDFQMSEVRSKRMKLVKRLRNMKRIKTFLMSASKLLKASLVAAAAGIAIDVVGGTLLDVVMADPDVEISPMNVVKMAINNLVESVTLGLVKGPYDLSNPDKEEQVQEEKQKQEYKKEKSSSTVSQSAPPQDKPAAAESKPKATQSTQATPLQAAAAPAPAPAASAPSSSSSSGMSVQKLSEDVGAKEADIKQTAGASITMIDNSKTIIAAKSDDVPTDNSAQFSVQVGR